MLYDKETPVSWPFKDTPFYIPQMISEKLYCTLLVNQRVDIMRIVLLTSVNLA